jgi:single-strand DNA-binding protein
MIDMAGYVNKVILIGRLGRDPETRTLQNGSKTTSFSIATSETWNDKASGERKEKTQWHRIVIWNDRIGEVAEKYLKKGSMVYIEGQLESRKFTDKDGAEREVTEVVIQRFKGELTLMDSRQSGGDSMGDQGGYAPRERASAPARAPAARGAAPSWDAPRGGDMDDDIPF